MFGITLPVNFHSPYKATGIIEFWRRWHMTLFRFLRDYLYFPLGGNRLGPVRRYMNMAIVMLLGGLWHGANWTFVVWGAVHGALLTMNHAWRSLPISRRPGLNLPAIRTAFMVMTFLAVTLAWVPFRAGSLASAGNMFAALFGLAPEAALPPAIFRWPAAFLLLGVGTATFVMPNTNQIFAKFSPVLGLTGEQLRHSASLVCLDWKVACIASGMLVLSVLHLSLSMKKRP